MLRWFGVLAVLLLTLVAAPGQAGTARTGTITAAQAPSAALGEEIRYNVYLPSGYARGQDRYPVLYLLHGRGDSMEAWTRVKDSLDRMIAAKEIPALIAVMPDAPWNERGNWYVDSAYSAGKPVETAFTRDLVQHVDATYRTAPIRNARLVGGYSMGGAGALRYALAHQDLFSGAIVLSPAVYTPLPPADSSARDYGAFGQGEEKFSDEVYQRLNYPNLLKTLDQPVNLFIAVGDDEYANPDPADARHDLDFESAALYNAARRVPAVSAQLRIMDGGHDWSVWQPGFEQAMSALGPTLSTVPPTGLGDTRYQATSAGGVSEHAVGMSTTDAIVVGDGWTTKLATDQTERLYGVADLPDGGVLAAGYTKGDLDGKHPGNTTDDAFVASLDAGGKTRWITQFGVAGTADRIYGLATAPDGGAYVAGYTKGALDGANAGDKDAFLARVNPDGTLAWTRQLGGTGEDKAYGVAADAQGAYVVGSASAALPGTTALGGLDGWVAAYGADGARRWVTSVGGADDDRINGVAISGGKAVITGLSGGDLLARAYTAAGRQSWTATVSTPETDEGAAVVPLADGGVRVVGYTRGRIGVPAGGADVLAVRFDARGRQQEAAQLGTARDDGVDAFGEPNLYASATRISGITGDGVFLKADR